MSVIGVLPVGHENSIGIMISPISRYYAPSDVLGFLALNEWSLLFDALLEKLATHPYSCSRSQVDMA